MKVETALELIMDEFTRATKTHRPFHSPHEGYAVILEELDELWEAIRTIKNFDQRNSEMKKEAAQVAAMSMRFLCDLIDEKAKRPKKILDIACMPNLSPKVTDGLHSVSKGKIYWTDENYVTCREHGACLCVNKDRTIWRCPTCHEGAFVVWNDKELTQSILIGDDV